MNRRRREDPLPQHFSGQADGDAFTVTIRDAAKVDR
jgi:hypothetical protein